MQESVQTWEAQAQENLQHMDQLKALLEESAFWHSEQTGAPQNAHTGTLAHQAPTGEAHLMQHLKFGDCHLTCIIETRIAICTVLVMNT